MRSSVKQFRRLRSINSISQLLVVAFLILSVIPVTKCTKNNCSKHHQCDIEQKPKTKATGIFGKFMVVCHFSEQSGSSP